MPHRDRDAANAYRRAYRLKLRLQRRARERATCSGCEEPLRPRNLKYCSVRCHQATQYRLYIQRWLAGEISGGSVVSVSDHVRRYLIEQGGECCSRCGWAERHPVTGKVPLEIDHLNGAAMRITVRRRTATVPQLLCAHAHLSSVEQGKRAALDHGAPRVSTRSRRSDSN
jgi:hypothetical protein